ncbi:MAG: hypothetical protein R2825_18100 [Saprospiraceae bacterium]
MAQFHLHFAGEFLDVRVLKKHLQREHLEVERALGRLNRQVGAALRVIEHCLLVNRIEVGEEAEERAVLLDFEAAGRFHVVDFDTEVVHGQAVGVVHAGEQSFEFIRKIFLRQIQLQRQDAGPVRVADDAVKMGEVGSRLRLCFGDVVLRPSGNGREFAGHVEVAGLRPKGGVFQPLFQRAFAEFENKHVAVIVPCSVPSGFDEKRPLPDVHLVVENGLVGHPGHLFRFGQFGEKLPQVLILRCDQKLLIGLEGILQGFAQVEETDLEFGGYCFRLRSCVVQVVLGGQGVAHGILRQQNFLPAAVRWFHLGDGPLRRGRGDDCGFVLGKNGGRCLGRHFGFPGRADDLRFEGFEAFRFQRTLRQLDALVRYQRHTEIKVLRHFHRQLEEAEQAVAIWRNGVDAVFFRVERGALRLGREGYLFAVRGHHIRPGSLRPVGQKWADSAVPCRQKSRCKGRAVGLEPQAVTQQISRTWLKANGFRAGDTGQQMGLAVHHGLFHIGFVEEQEKFPGGGEVSFTTVLFLFTPHEAGGLPVGKQGVGFGLRGGTGSVRFQVDAVAVVGAVPAFEQGRFFRILQCSFSGRPGKGNIGTGRVKVTRRGGLVRQIRRVDAHLHANEVVRPGLTKNGEIKCRPTAIASLVVKEFCPQTGAQQVNILIQFHLKTDTPTAVAR